MFFSILPLCNYNTLSLRRQFRAHELISVVGLLLTRWRKFSVQHCAAGVASCSNIWRKTYRKVASSAGGRQ
jgi:hypothetical protein